MGDDLRRVLLIEDDPDSAQMIWSYLAGAFHITHVGTLGEALFSLGSEPFDAVLADLSLPDSEGAETFREILAHAPDTALVVLTATCGEALGLDAVREGAQEYLLKGQVGPRLLERAIYFAIERARVKADLRNQALKDPLTGLLNRRGFTVLAELQLRLTIREHRSAVLAFADLDRFKAINDRYGHAAGDRALKRVADGLLRAFRASDVLARLGGDEFVAFATSPNVQDPEAVGERIRRSVHAIPTRDVFRLDLSVGVVPVAPSTTATIEALLEEADRAMYADKRRRAPAQPAQPSLFQEREPLRARSRS
jgi:diguanylate cyclase (GGDEF)-like protein